MSLWESTGTATSLPRRWCAELRDLAAGSRRFAQGHFMIHRWRTSVAGVRLESGSNSNCVASGKRCVRAAAALAKIVVEWIGGAVPRAMAYYCMRRPFGR